MFNTRVLCPHQRVRFQKVQRAARLPAIDAVEDAQQGEVPPEFTLVLLQLPGHKGRHAGHDLHQQRFCKEGTLLWGRKKV